jgi:uncharacterized caspase-like protein
MRRVTGLACAVLLICLGVMPSKAEKRVALVIGNSAYREVPPLANPANDAKLVADTLRALGFSLVGGKEQLDLDKTDFERAVQDFGTQLRGADVVLFYYAGHGVQVRGLNYLLPIDAALRKKPMLIFNCSISMQTSGKWKPPARGSKSSS